MILALVFKYSGIIRGIVLYRLLLLMYKKVTKKMIEFFHGRKFRMGGAVTGCGGLNQNAKIPI